MEAGAQLIAVAIVLGSTAWAVAFVAVAMMADRQVSRIIGTREEAEVEKRFDLLRESVDEQLHSIQEQVSEALKTANSAAVSVGLSPSDDRKRKA